jgi:hypothetical protein
MLAFLMAHIPFRVPTYVLGVSTPGLSGGGNLVLQSTTIAIQVQITTLPPAYGEVFGSPNTYLDFGWITPATSEGPEAGIRITRSTQVFPLPEATLSVDYSLPAGALITIGELQAG